MKKTVFISSMLTCIFVILYTFLINNNVNNSNIDYQENIKMVEGKKYKIKGNGDIYKNIDNKEDKAIFSSTTAYKKTYYVKSNMIDVYEDGSGKDKVIFNLYKDDVIVAYKDSNGYIYCEESSIGRKGWIKKDFDNLKGIVNKKSDFKVDVNLTKQKICVYNENNDIIRGMICSSGIIGNQETETPLGIFTVQSKGKYFYSNKYRQGGRYYIKFFANYLIHSIPIDQKGNIIEEEQKKLGFPSSHGCIRINMEDAKWMYDNIPVHSVVYIHH